MGCCSSTETNDCCSSGSSGSCCTSGSDIDTQMIGVQAEQLASMLVESSEYTEFVRLADEVNESPEVQQILMQIRSRNTAFADRQSPALQALQAQLETLAAVQAYRAAEADVRKLLSVVDEIISTAAGVPFAANAVRSGCG